MNRYMLIAMILGILSIALILSESLGVEDAKEAKVRLELIWPNLMSMQKQDRAFLVGLAKECRLDSRALLKDEVIECLREASENPSYTPIGVDRENAPEALQTLIANAMPKCTGSLDDPIDCPL